MSALQFSYFNPREINITEYQELLREYSQDLKEACEDRSYSVPESCLRLPYDADPILDHVRGIARSFSGDINYCIVVGIGGSSLGAKAVYNALEESDTTLLFIETLSPQRLREVEEKLSDAKAEEVVINIISKSGTTTETIANAAYISTVLKERFGKIKSRMVVTTEYLSPLWRAAKEAGVKTLAVPQHVSGRFSVLSPVGVLPLLLAGCNVEKLFKGAQDILDTFFENPEHNFAIDQAALLHAYRKAGMSIENMFFFNEEFEQLGKWNRQLSAESLGKEHDKAGDVVRAGMTPIVSIGTTDLHATGQLYFGGPHDKYTTFIKAPQAHDMKVPNNTLFEKVAPDLSGKSIADIRDAIYDGVTASYRESDLPFSEIIMSKKGTYALGQFLQARMLQVIYQAHLSNVDAFNQPGVEMYKQNSHAMLTERN